MMVVGLLATPGVAASNGGNECDFEDDAIQGNCWIYTYTCSPNEPGGDPGENCSNGELRKRPLMFCTIFYRGTCVADPVVTAQSIIDG